MKICPQCKQENPDQAKFCLGCGIKISHLQKASGSESVDHGERRQMTILFCDLVDSTPLSERMDPEDYRQMILDYHNAAEKVIERHGGKVGNYLGDGLLVYFGYPEGLENAAITGVQTGLAVIDSIEEVRKRWEDLDQQIYVKIRVGIHTGVVIVDDHLALGETVNLAARLEGFAPHNGVVISSKTQRLVQGWFKLKSLGKKNLKGISEPMEIFQVLGESGAKTRLDASRTRGLSPLVGRQLELTKLHKYFDQVKAGRGCAALLVGEAGIGKSRLVDKLEEEIGQDANNRILEARCSTYHINSALYPLFEMIRNELLQIGSDDSDDQKTKKLERLLDSDVPESLKTKKEFLSLLAEYIGISVEKYPPLVMSPFSKREKLLEAVTQLLLNQAGQKNLLLIIEDLHWADASTLEWLRSFIDRKHEGKVFLLCTSRPTLRHNLQKNVDLIIMELHRLSLSEMKEICLHQSNGKDLPKEIMNKIMEKTEGVPLFIEELTKMMLESDRLIEKQDRFEFTGALESINIPSTLQDSLLARLDQLKDVREIVQVGSVIGRHFSLAMLLAIIPENEFYVEKAIKKLLHAELIQKYKEGDQADYSFKHALIQDTAYDSMLRNRRRQIHSQVADVMLEKFAAVCENQPEVLAHHFSEANQLEQAVPQWLKAGQHASRTNAAQEAIAHLKKGLELLPRIADAKKRKNLELDLTLTLGGTYMVSHGFPNPLVKETFDKAKDIAQTMEVSPKLALILFNLLNYYFNTEDYQSFDDLLEQMIKLSKDSDSGYWFRLFATHFQGGSMIRGDINSALPCFEQVIDLFDPSLTFPWELTPSGYLPYATKGWWMLTLEIAGFKDQARTLAEDQLSFAEGKFKDSTSLYHVYTFPALYGLFTRDWDYVIDILETYLPMARSFGDPIFTLTADVYYQIAKSFQKEQGAFKKAVQLVNVCFDIGFKAFAVTMSGFIAEGYLKNDQPEAALIWIEKIQAHVDKTGTYINSSELHRLKGRVYSIQAKSYEEIELEFKKALDLAGEQKSKTFELRAAMDLGQFWHSQGKTKKALKLLKGSFDWFKEGLDSTDLTEARTLMHQLQQDESLRI